MPRGDGPPLLAAGARLAATALAAFVAAALEPLAAGAHATPERLVPAPGAVLDVAPIRVEAWFSQDVRRNTATRLWVQDGAGKVVSAAAVVDDADRRHLWTALAFGLGAGEYLVAYQSLSDADRDISGGCFLFFVGREAAVAAASRGVAPEAPPGCPIAATAPAANQSADDTGHGSRGIALVAGAAVGTVLAALGLRDLASAAVRRRG